MAIPSHCEGGFHSTVGPSQSAIGADCFSTRLLSENVFLRRKMLRRRNFLTFTLRSLKCPSRFSSPFGTVSAPDSNEKIDRRPLATTASIQRKEVDHDICRPFKSLQYNALRCNCTRPSLRCQAILRREISDFRPNQQITLATQIIPNHCLPCRAISMQSAISVRGSIAVVLIAACDCGALAYNFA